MSGWQVALSYPKQLPRWRGRRRVYQLHDDGGHGHPPAVATQVSIAPSPAHGSFTLRLPALAGHRTVQATLLNVLGQAITTRTLTLTATGATTDFDGQGLTQGLYLLRLTEGSEALRSRRMTVE